MNYEIPAEMFLSLLLKLENVSRPDKGDMAGRQYHFFIHLF